MKQRSDGAGGPAFRKVFGAEVVASVEKRRLCQLRPSERKLQPAHASPEQK